MLLSLPATVPAALLAACYTTHCARPSRAYRAASGASPPGVSSRRRQTDGLADACM